MNLLPTTGMRIIHLVLQAFVTNTRAVHPNLPVRSSVFSTAFVTQTVTLKCKG